MIYWLVYNIMRAFFFPPRYFQSECLQVIFHAILPLHVWEWTEGDSHLYVRFGSDLLGDWNRNWGEFQVSR